MNTEFERALSIFGETLNCKLSEGNGDSLELYKIEGGVYDLFEIPSGVTLIKTNSAYRCAINKLYVPNSVQTIQTRAFDAVELTEIVFEDGDKPLRIENNALGFGNIQRIEVPSRVETFGRQIYPQPYERNAVEMQFIGGENQTDFDQEILYRFNRVDLTRCKHISFLESRAITAIVFSETHMIGLRSLLISDEIKRHLSKWVRETLLPVKEEALKHGALEEDFNF